MQTGGVFRTLAALIREGSIYTRTSKGIRCNAPSTLANRYHSQSALSSLVITVKWRTYVYDGSDGTSSSNAAANARPCAVAFTTQRGLAYAHTPYTYSTQLAGGGLSGERERAWSDWEIFLCPRFSRAHRALCPLNYRRCLIRRNCSQN